MSALPLPSASSFCRRCARIDCCNRGSQSETRTHLTKSPIVISPPLPLGSPQAGMCPRQNSLTSALARKLRRNGVSRIGRKAMGLPDKSLICRVFMWGSARTSKENRDDARKQIGERRGLPTGHCPVLGPTRTRPNKPPCHLVSRPTKGAQCRGHGAVKAHVQENAHRCHPRRGNPGRGG